LTFAGTEDHLAKNIIAEQWLIFNFPATFVKWFGKKILAPNGSAGKVNGFRRATHGLRGWRGCERFRRMCGCAAQSFRQLPESTFFRNTGGANCQEQNLSSKICRWCAT
jgi:hypothetical protein